MAGLLELQTFGHHVGRLGINLAAVSEYYLCEGKAIPGQ
jgi:hypothetical protein